MEQKLNGMGDSHIRTKPFDHNHQTDVNDDDEEEDEIDDHSAHLVELNNRIKNNFMSYCLSFLQEDEDARECVHGVWNKYLQCVGDVSMISAFFDTLSYSVKSSIFPKYQDEILAWCRDVLHIQCHAIIYSTFYSETFSRIIRYVLKQSNFDLETSERKAVIYVSADFDRNLKHDLLTSITSIQFEHVRKDVLFEDMIDVDRLQELVERDSNHSHLYPLMIIANAGTNVLGRCDELTKLKQFSRQHNLWLHVTGDLLGSLALLSTVKENVNISCDSLSIDTIKLLGIQNLPYLTFFLRPMVSMTNGKPTESNFGQDEQINTNDSSTVSTTSTNRTSSSSSSYSSSTTTNDNNSSASPPFYDAILHNPSITFLSIWSISQRCSKSNVLYHMKHSFELVNLLSKRLKQMKTIRILNNDDYAQGVLTYQRICEGDTLNDPLPKTIIIFRFETTDILDIEHLDDLHGYVDLLNLWLFDKLSQQYPKMNLELLKCIHFQMLNNSNENSSTQTAAHAIRFAPLEHLLDTIEEQNMQAFVDDVQRYIDILVATMTARARLKTVVAKYENLVSISMPHWAGIGAVRYIPSHEKADVCSYDTNTIQAELARKLQTNDSAFSLGGEPNNDQESMFYLRLGMIRKQDDLDILLQKIAVSGKETEVALKYVEDMAQKIKQGIEKVQKDLQDENQQMLAQEGLLRQLPVISNIMSWWSPSPTASPLATKGRSFDLNSGRIESTENTYAYRMQINKQSPHAPMHNDDQTPALSPSPSNSD
ncbi:unnamed protein product [Adineta ricciae]|uniref:Pyridoxal-dependent decarboxylase domain-containing protein 1 n=1 Tax=Adineta ricciae TaxID=249248 RepID=A0A814WUG0_ADIRI|nr:unnamed protein product [Adineta ricciae]CAF1270821.1 unnamed protein product [Adineta ricciae]